MKNKKKILKNSKLLYKLIKMNLISEKVKKRCCNFKLLRKKKLLNI
ncbi:hypothetical protein VYE96_12785 [Fusobacterium pseudoperiodonticum]|nr:hypothetical protein [Fusobacterium pseudoperiodonticum]